MVLHDQKILFIHIPKTGGTSIEIFFNCYRNKDCVFGWDRRYKIWRQHATCEEYIKNKYVEPEIFESYFKFAFVRNPWDRVLSEYRWRKISKRYDLSLKQFVISYDQIKEKKYRNKVGLLTHMLPQYKFIYDTKETLHADFIGKFENLQEDFNKVCEKLGIEKRILPHSKKTKHKNYEEYYDNETREIVEEKYRKDIELFGYEF
jgi:hypothetical protein